MKFLAGKTLRNCFAGTTSLYRMKEVFFLQCFESSILEISRVKADVSWMKEDLFLRLASVMWLAEYSVIAAWTSI